MVWNSIQISLMRSTSIKEFLDIALLGIQYNKIRTQYKELLDIARHQQTIAANSSSSEDDLSLGADHEKVPAPTCDAASSIMVS